MGTQAGGHRSTPETLQNRHPVRLSHWMSERPRDAVCVAGQLALGAAHPAAAAPQRLALPRTSPGRHLWGRVLARQGPWSFALCVISIHPPTSESLSKKPCLPPSLLLGGPCQGSHLS